MGKTTKAVVFTAPREVEVRDIKLPDLGPQDVLVRTIYSGISIGTETWALTNRYKGTIDQFPQIPGYQRAGVVEEVGTAVSTINVGDRVFVRDCRVSAENDLHPASWNGQVGHSVCHESRIFLLPDGVKESEACFGIQIAVGCLGVRMSNVSKDDFVVVIGQGLIGQMSAQAARRRGAKVLTADLLQKRVDLSTQYSADIAVNSGGVDLQEVVRRETAGGLADIVIEATGRASMFDSCLDLIKREGTISMQGYYPDIIEIEFHKTHQKRAFVNFPCAWDDEDLRHILGELVDGGSIVEPLVTHTYPTNEAPEAYKYILENPGEVLAVNIKWD